MSQLSDNPFIYVHPVHGSQFFGRRAEINTVMSRLRNRESTVIVGGPRCGKTSFLMHLADKDVLIEQLGVEDASKIIPIIMSLYNLPNNFTIKHFWEHVLQPLQTSFNSETITRYLQEVRQNNYDSVSLENLFDEVAFSGHTLLLLLDEFELLLKHKNFQDSSFFAALRSLISISEGLVIVTASRLNILDLNIIGKGLIIDNGSPFFNPISEIPLKGFDEDTVEKIFSQPDSIISTANQRNFIQRMAGHQPFLLQAMAGAFQENPTNAGLASEKCYNQISFYFSDLWISLPEISRTIVIILSLSEIGSKTRGVRIPFETIENNKKFEAELKRLSKYGLAKHIQKTGYWVCDWDYFFPSIDGKWVVETFLFAWWVRDQVLTNSPECIIYDWIKGRYYRDWLSTNDWRQILTLGESSLNTLALSIFSDLSARG